MSATNNQQVAVGLAVQDVATLILSAAARAENLLLFYNSVGGADAITDEALGDNSATNHISKTDLVNALFTFQTVLNALKDSNNAHLNNLLATRNAPIS